MSRTIVFIILVQYDLDDCNLELNVTGGAGNFTLPMHGIPNYQQNSNCRIRFYTSPGYQMAFSFLYFQVTNGTD